MGQYEKNGVVEYKTIENRCIPVHYDRYNVYMSLYNELLFWHGYDLRGVQA